MNKAQRIRAIFEGNVIAMYSPDDERYKAAEKANRRRVSMQAQARAEQARGSHVTAGQKTIDTLGKNLSPEMLRKVMQKDIKAHHERRRKSMNSSTNHYVAGIRSLFEAVLLEKRGQSPLSKVFGDKMRKHVAKQRQRGKESIESSKKLVAKGVYSPEHTEDTAEIVRQGEKDLIKSARSGGRQILGKPPQHDSTDHVRAGLRALFENNYLRLHPVGKPGDQAIHNTLRAHFDSLDPKIGADLHNQMDRHIKMYHYVRETPGEAGAHAELRRFEHEHLRNAAKTGSQGVTPNDVRQHFHMFNTDDPSDRLAHTAIKDSFYRPKESKSNIRAGLKALFETVLDEAQDPKKLKRLQNKRLKPMTAWDATINILPKAKTRSQKKVDKNAAKLRAKETDYPDPQDP